jgi:NAD(P)-dependent dehydrogenase (short-subunit alcohol dehydrogenase family)
MDGWTAKDIPYQNGRVAIITGANSGVGYESAVALARKGARVVMACRSMDRAERARQELLARASGAAVDVLPLDLGNLESVRTFAESFNAHYDRLDILMNNAGIMVPPYGKTADGFETQFGTNHLGHFALTAFLLPKLLETPASRVVTVSSSAYFNGRIDFADLQGEKRYRPWTAYAQSKLANILFTQELERRLKAARADVISVASHPGYAITNLQANLTTGIMDRTLFPILKRFMSQPADLGATYQLYAATAPHVQGGDFYGPRWILIGKVVRVGLNARGKDTALAARLWQVSEQLTGVPFEILRTAPQKYPVIA